MSVNSVNFSTMGATPLRANSSVSFAGQEVQQPAKSKKGKYVAAGLTLAAITAAVVFRKDIGKLFNKLPASIKDPIAKVGNKIKGFFGKITGKAKVASTNAAQATQGVTTAASGFGAKIMSGLKSVGNVIVKGWNVVKDFCVKMFQKFMGLFAKPKAPVV